MIYESILELIGGTPLLNVKKYSDKYADGANILCKLEYLNPAGSSKDRAAARMIADAEAAGLIREDTVIIEPTSGNTGIGFAAIAARLGYRVILTMPDTMSVERIKLLRAYGAEIILTDGRYGMAGAIKKAEELAASLPSAFIPEQFSNPSNRAAHRDTTGPEIWRDTDGKVDIFVAGIGTGGTISGVGEYLKSQNPNIQIVGVEPSSSPLITRGRSGAHGLQGIGANFIPDNFKREFVDRVISVSEADSYATAKELARLEGILCGITSGSALHVATELSHLPENKGKTIVALLPDTGARYLSTPLFDE
ncbi:MAG: cysteine synthase A [Clostridia bacterium]|nr:cysteine synthase A [Clostridia bacterium]